MDEAHGKPLIYKQCVKSNVTSVMNVYHVLHTYSTQGLEAVQTIKRSCKSDVSNLKVDGRVEAQLIQLACSKAPESHARWTLNLLVEKSRAILDVPVSRATIGRILKKQIGIVHQHMPTNVNCRIGRWAGLFGEQKYLFGNGSNC